MKGCLAPSEVPGISSGEASIFGGLAEDIIYSDFWEQYGGNPSDIFCDDNNPATYLFFLASRNPQFTEALQKDFYTRLLGEKILRIPDIIVHSVKEKAFYEIKPDSQSGRAAGMEKVGILSAVYPFYRMPYTAGNVFVPRDHSAAFYGTGLRVTLTVRRAAPGLIVYKLCLESEKALELATLAILMRYIVRAMNKQKDTGGFRPVDLEPVFRQDKQLVEVAQALGVAMAAAVVAVGWKYFWKAVVVRFALRESVALGIAALDGPSPVGKLIALGLNVWMVIDIIRLSDQLWQDAAAIKQRGA